MITKGYVLVYCFGEYEDSYERLLGFSENRDELKQIEIERNAEIMKLRERFSDTEILRKEYMTNFDTYRISHSLDDSMNLNADQLQEFLNLFPIPEELEDLISSYYEEDDGVITGSVEQINYDELYSYYYVRELAGIEQ